ncbi:MAG TPA: hypothetical protein VEC19_16035 [Usitatibacter sp.]|nr:hypothetical protein [Usitatibacter sp.]
MALIPVLLVSSLMALGPQWAIIDLPYPEVTGAETAPAIDAQIAEAVTNYAKGRGGKSLSRKPEISNLKVDRATASLRLTMGDRVETVTLMRVNNEWRVVQSLTEGREY